MNLFQIENFSFKYPTSNKKALNNISLEIEQGEFLAIMGSSGSGKTTLLRNLKPALAPHGERVGNIFFTYKEEKNRCKIEKLDARIQASAIGFVLQNPDNQIVTDKVWHELAFGLENLGYDKQVIRTRVAEMANFFGIQEWFDKDTKELSGGQKQILNLASVMAMKPEVLILDEPTSMLDPIMAGEFIQLVRRINREIGTTIILSEHRLDEVLSIADRTVVFEDGKIIADDTPAEVGVKLAEQKKDIFVAMPTSMQAYIKVFNEGYGCDLECPIDVRGGRIWLNKLLSGKQNIISSIKEDNKNIEIEEKNLVYELKDVWFRYSRNGKDILKGFSLNVREGEILALVGGNGTGKSTTLNIFAGIRKSYRGSNKLYGKKISKYEDNELRNGLIGMLPQDPQSIFVTDKVTEDLLEVLSGENLSQEEKTYKINKVAKLTEITDLLESHPYDISGGEQQRVALAKVLLLNPKIILLDEPTKGIDNFFKAKLGEILEKLKEDNKTVIIVSHDIEFVGVYADRCAMIFDGKITAQGNATKFFSGNSFYTTSANKMSSHIYKNAITATDVARLTLLNLRDNLHNYENNCKSDIDYIDKDENIDTKDSDNSKKDIEYKKDKKIKKSKIKLPQARELVLMSVIIALAVTSRAVFFMIPQVKPILAVVIAGSYCLGPRSGFVVGAMSAFVSNFMFGQGPWTIWQMIGMGLIGLIAGGYGKKTKMQNVNVLFAPIFGVLTFVIYGGIVDIWTIFAVGEFSIKSIFMIYITAIPFNLILAISTVVFIYLFANPMINKIKRIKIKFGFNLN